MDDKDFRDLQNELHRLIIKLNRLQALHRRETGRDYEISGPMEDDQKDYDDDCDQFNRTGWSPTHGG